MKKRIIIVTSVVAVGVIALGLGLGLGLGLQSSSKSNEDGISTESTPTTVSVTPPLTEEQLNSRIDCYPELRDGVPPEVVKVACESRGCTYDPVLRQNEPICYISPDSPLGAGYTANITSQTESGFTARLTLRRSSSFQYRATASSAQRSIQPTDTAVMEVEFHGENVLRIKLYPQVEGQSSRYEVPRDIVNITYPPATSPTRRSYNITLTNTTKLAFQVVRTNTGTVLWDTGVGGTVLADQFLSLSTRLASKKVFGFGENVHQKFRHDLNFTTWGLFARDEIVGHEKSNHYSVHPFYLCVEDDGNSHGVLLLNSNAMDYSFTSLPMLTYRTIGGVLDFYMFLGPSPESVIQQYTALVGRPYMPPYWSLGFQLCRYGYNSLDRLKAAVDRTHAAGVPLDVQYADIDHYDERKVFTIDQVNFAGISEYFEELRNNGMRTIIILDPFIITNVTGYEPFELGLSNDIFIKWPNRTVMPEADYNVTNSTAMLGFVWPKGKVVFPDFLLARAGDVWSDLIVNHSRKIPFDGLWIDMNEPANFGTNEERPWNWPEDDKPYWSLHCPEGPLDDPVYRTMAAFFYDSDSRLARISDKTLCMIAVQGNTSQYQHYDVHNLYGASQIEPTLRGLRLSNPGQRGLVLGRSTFPGSGKNAGHWLGDNFSEWRSMAESIIGMLEFNLFGIPYVGADICGFLSETTPQLCMRWMQLGAFYPYARNHNQADNKIEQDPGSFDEVIQRLSREAMLTRYSLLPYLYTLFYHAHTRGDTVVRALFHEFWNDNNTFDIDRQFLWGPALLIVPILEENQTSLNYYLPRGIWYDFYTNKGKTVNNGSMQTMDVSFESAIPLFVRGGFILVTQEPANNTHFSRKNAFHAQVYLDSDGSANGDLFWDDGVSIDTSERGQYYYAQLTCRQNVFNHSVQFNNVTREMSGLVMSSVTVIGVWSPSSLIVTVNGSVWTRVSYNGSVQELVIENLQWPMTEDLIIMWDVGTIETNRINCAPEGADKEKCIEKGCLWLETSSPGVPWCYINSSSYGYRAFNVNVVENTDHIQLEHISGEGSMFGGDVSRIAIDIVHINDWLLRVKVYPLETNSYEVPVSLNMTRGGDRTSALYQVHYNNTTSPFSLRVTRKSTGTVIWDTSLGGMTVAKQLLQLAVRVPSTRLFGLGESVRSTFQRRFDYVTIPMFARDQPPAINANLYGVHPYYMVVEDLDGRAHGVLLLNSNAMEVALQPAPAVVYRTTGGILDFYLIVSDNPEMVTSRYTELIGRPYLPPYWSLGFQLSRYGYNSLSRLRDAVNRTLTADIPLDVQYADIDHMNNSQDFTYDRVNYAGLPEYVQQLQETYGMRFIIILDPAIVAIDSDYKPFTTGRDQNVFIHWPSNANTTDINRFNSTMMHGYVWPNGETVFPDFLNPRAQTWWQQNIIEHHSVIPFDGLWIDMNEPANFGTNEDKPFNWPPDRPDWSLKCPTSDLDDPPYKPQSIWGPRLSDKTICMVGLQSSNTHNYTHYDVHNLYGWSQTPPTLRALNNVTGQRSIVISRSTYVGSGQHTGHWLGDNASEWPQLHQSIIGLLDFNLFGIPYIGADICGYFNNATAELCQRWMQLGAFYTFSRNHNGFAYIDQDPAAFGEQVANSSRFILRIRYSLLPFLYTLFYKAHVTGSTVIRPLHHEFFTDPETYNIDKQFLWGPCLLITPVLEVGQTSVDAYLPAARWFNFYTGVEESVTRQFVTLNAPLDTIPLHLRGGHIIVTQAPAINTNHSRMNNFSLIVCPDALNSAVGELFWDDGVSIATVENHRFTLVSFTFNKTAPTVFNVSSLVSEVFNDLSPPPIEQIRVLGVDTVPTEAAINQGGIITDITSSIKYNATTKELLLVNLELTVSTAWTVSWWI